MKLVLNKTKSHADRYYLINGAMGNHGKKENHANHKYSIANGIDRGNGYQGYSSVSYFLKESHFPKEAKSKVIEICKKEGLIYS